MAADSLGATIDFWRARLLAEKAGTRALRHAVREKKLTYVGRRKFVRLAQAAEFVRLQKVPGVFLEAGVALGGTAILLARLRPQGRPLHLYDTFGMIPPPGPEDETDAHERYETIASGQSRGIKGETYYGYRDDLVAEVAANLAGFGIEAERDAVSFFPGTFEDRLHPDGPIALAHIDCDWYHSVVTCMERIFPRLSHGGVMVFDDYGSYSGCRKAVDSFLAAHDDVSVLFKERSVGIRKRA